MLTYSHQVGVKTVQEGAVALPRVDEHVFDLLPVEISREGGGTFGKVDLDALEHDTKEARWACLKFGDFSTQKS